MSGQTELHQKDQKSWDDRWETNVIPFDKGASHTAFTNLLRDAGKGRIPEIPRSGKALVPGCGRGYDVHSLSTHGLDTTGIEVSKKAVEEANKWIQSQAPHPSSSANVELGDFFKWKQDEPGTTYDVLYDYTFLCALPPVLREAWAETYTRLSKPGSIFITLQFPLDDPGTSGPPYSLSRQIYTDLLGGAWEEVYARNVREEESRAASGPEGREQVKGAGDVNAFREGRERVAVWRRREKQVSAL